MDRTRVLHALQGLERIRLDGLRFRLIDAKDMVVGRLAADIATLLQGKDKPTYNPKHNGGDVVVVVNAAHVHFTHDKWKTKQYKWHTGHPGGLRSRSADAVWERDPTHILWHAVNGMLPKNRMRAHRLDKLKIFPEGEHPFDGLELVPHVPKPKLVHAPEISWPLPDGFTPMNAARFAMRAMAGRKHPPRQPLVGVHEAFIGMLDPQELALLRASTRSTQEQQQQGKKKQ